MDEARVGQQGTLTRVWAKRGMRPRAVRDHRYTWAWIFGAVCPERAVGAAVVLPEVNVEAMNIHLAEISRCVAQGAHAVLVLDGAGWHTSPRLRLPGNISLLPLPRYAPELNPVERVWLHLRERFLSHHLLNSNAAIVDACCQAWNALTGRRGNWGDRAGPQRPGEGAPWRLAKQLTTDAQTIYTESYGTTRPHARSDAHAIHSRSLDQRRRVFLFRTAMASARRCATSTVGVLGDHPHRLRAVGLVDPHGPRGADPVNVQEEHDLADDLLLGPAGHDARLRLSPLGQGSSGTR